MQERLEIARCRRQVQALLDLQDQLVCTDAVVATTDDDQSFDALQIRGNLGCVRTDGEAFFKMAPPERSL